MALSLPIGFTFFSNSSQFRTPIELIRQWRTLSTEQKQQYAKQEQNFNSLLSECATEFSQIPQCGNHAITPVLAISATNSSNTFLSTAPSSPPHSGVFNFRSSLRLDSIRSCLIRLEESIIFALIERAQFRLNQKVYELNGLAPSLDSPLANTTFLRFFLRETEILHAKTRRYTSPDEHPYIPLNELPKPILLPAQYPNTIKEGLHYSINLNDKIYEWYIHTVLPAICLQGDDGNYGSAVVCDVNSLQLLSTRVHYGKFVAEVKFRDEPQLFTEAIRNKDVNKLTQLITKPVVEEAILKRVHMKAATYGTEPITERSNESQKKLKVSPDAIAEIYAEIMKLTKEVQIQYLLRRLDEND